MAGTVALHADDPGFRFVLAHATDGAAGDIQPDFPATPETLGSVRRDEDELAWEVLGRPPDRHAWFGYDDGRLAEVPFAAPTASPATPHRPLTTRCGRPKTPARGGALPRSAVLDRAEFGAVERK
jgi:LmbE family N-acetylglucosaminyl deacetylase